MICVPYSALASFLGKEYTVYEKKIRNNRRSHRKKRSDVEELLRTEEMFSPFSTEPKYT
jgi:hypothetical protein